MTKQDKQEVLKELVNYYTILLCMFWLTNDNWYKIKLSFLAERIRIDAMRLVSTPIFKEGGHMKLVNENGNEVVIK